MNHKKSVVIIGAGFTGLSASYELSRSGIDVTVLESESEIGGLAAAFKVGGESLDRFYHHWFTNDENIMSLVNELGLRDKIEINPTNTGVYFANKHFKLSTPLDLLKFSPLSLIDRFRLGLLTIRVRNIKDWKSLESKTAINWLIELGGERVYKVLWEPLLKGKFGPFSESISAVWFWNKLKLRGGSRGKGGEERLMYFKGGFIALLEEIALKIRFYGGNLLTNKKVISVSPDGVKWRVVTADGKCYECDHVIVTVALPIISEMIKEWASKEYIQNLNAVKYIGNVCLVLELTRSLSSTYWLNVNDPSFPFVGVIEHTNFEKPETYGGSHIVYLSKYLPVSDDLFRKSEKEFYDYAFPYLKKMFPEFDHEMVIKQHLWRAEWSQPVVEKNYSQVLLKLQSPRSGFHIATMAQIYPEDRGTNYAVREGRKVGEFVSKLILGSRYE